jgi:hypothetical protein
MRAHIVQRGVVVDTIMVSNLDHPVGEGRQLIDASTGNIGWLYVDGQLVEPEVERPRDELAKAIDLERDRRISAGFDFNGTKYQSRLPDASRSGDWEVFSGKALEALIAVIGGAQPGDLRWSDPAEDFAWIAADNSRVAMDAQTVIALGKAASAHRSAHTFAGSDLKAMQPIPTDYTDNKWWP